MAEPSWILQLFSSPELRDIEQERKADLHAGKPLAVLAYLAVEGQPAPRELLASLLWPAADARRGRASVRQALWVLRQVLGPDGFTSDDPLALSEDILVTDLDLFHDALEAEALDEAAAYWKGPLLEDLEFPRAREWQGWLDQIRLREERRFGEALTAGATRALGKGDMPAAIRWLQKAVEVRPYYPPHHHALVEVLMESHRLADAAAALDEARSALTDDEPWNGSGLNGGNAEDPFLELDTLQERLDGLRFGTADSSEPRVLRTEFVGRVSEFSRLSRGWKEAEKGRAQVALVLGPPGIGKTRLAEELSLLTDTAGGTVVMVKAVEVERTLEWGLASELVRLLHGLPGAAGISNSSAAVLGRLVPSLAGWQPGAGSASPSEHVEPAAVTDALLDLTSAVAEESPLLVVVDDLQWVDRSSRAALSHMARVLARKPVFVLFTCRTGEEDPEVAKAIDGLERAAQTPPVTLGPLGPDEVSELLALVLEPLESQALNDLGTRMYAVTRGNPLFLVEVLKLLQAEGLMEANGEGRWTIDPSCLAGPLPVPKTVESAIQRHLENLGETARIVAAYLAAQARPLRPEDLRRSANLDPFEVSEGIRGLFERDLVRRDSEGRLQFVHDAVAEAARQHLKPPSDVAAHGPWAWIGRRWWRAAMGLAGAVVVILIALLALQARADGEATYPFGQGRIWARGDSGVYWITPPSRPEEEWGVERTELPYPHSVLFGPYRITDGSTLWFARGSDGPGSTPYIGLPRPDGSVDPLWKVPGADVGFLGVSPDGRWALLFEAEVDQGPYRHDLVRLDLNTRTGVTIFEARNRLEGCSWAPDGQKIACVARWERDSVLILTPRGEELQRMGIPETSGDLRKPSWCADSDHLVLVARVGSVPTAAVVESSTGDYSLHPLTPQGFDRPYCTRDPPMAVAHGILADRSGAVVFDLVADTAFLVPGLPSQRIRTLTWVPDSVDPVIQSIRYDRDTVRIPLGERKTVSILGIRTDGEEVPLRVQAESSDPSVASVDPQGTITANGVGAVQIRARYADWLEDTVSVEVLPVEVPAVLFREVFEEGSLDDWDRFGEPLPELVEVDGDLVLNLNGDGTYKDGMASKGTFSIQAGATAEMEFQLPLTQRRRQRVGLCLEPDMPTVTTPQDPWLGRSPADGVCLRVPAEEDIKFDPREGRLALPGGAPVEFIDFPESMDSDAWTHLALQVRPDGTVTVVLNRSKVYEAQKRLEVNWADRWRVRITGASENAWAYVRQVTVWPGERY